MSLSKLRVAAIHQPWSAVEPPVTTADSIALWTDEVMRRLARECEIVCYSRQWKGLPNLTRYAEIDYVRVPVSIDRYVRKAASILDERGWRSARRPFFASKWCFRQFAAHVIKHLKKRGGADVVHVQNFSQFVPVIRDALPNAKIVLHTHAEWLAQLERDWVAPRLAATDSAIFCSNFYAEQTRRAWPEHATRCRAIYNGVTLEEFDHAPPFEPTKRGPRLLFVSRISPDKGVHILVDAFNRIVERHPTAELKIVGPFAMLPKAYCIDLSDEPMVKELAQFYDGRDYVEHLRQRLSPAAAQQVEITGAIPRADLVRQFKECDAYVMPSIYPEGCGIPIVEAAACRVPTVCTDRGGMPEVVEDGKTGLIVPAANADALASAIVRLLDDEPLRRSMGDAARQRAQRYFTWDRIAESLLAEYRRLLGGNRGDGIEIHVTAASSAAAAAHRSDRAATPGSARAPS
jgi:glycosyltransferase involved in cell wall biosynthesis